MTATAIRIIAPTDIEDPELTVAQISALGIYGSQPTVRKNIKALGIPTRIIDGRGTIAVRHSDLDLLRRPVRGPGSDDLDALVDRIRSQFSRLSDEHKAELGRLLHRA